jgi:hypothetical protein
MMKPTHCSAPPSLRDDWFDKLITTARKRQSHDAGATVASLTPLPVFPRTRKTFLSAYLVFLFSEWGRNRNYMKHYDKCLPSGCAEIVKDTPNLAQVSNT